jgi:hypothetical protein
MKLAVVVAAPCAAVIAPTNLCPKRNLKNAPPMFVRPHVRHRRQRDLRAALCVVQ